MQTNARSRHLIDAQLRDVFAHFPKVVLVLLFASVASGKQRADSDLVIAPSTRHPLTADETMAMIGFLAEHTRRAIDLIDLRVVDELLLGQIVRHGRRVLGKVTLYGELISKHRFEQADFMPYQARIEDRGFS